MAWSGLVGWDKTKLSNLDHRIVIWVYVAFAFEDILERKSVALSSLAAGFSSRAWDGLHGTEFESVCLESPIQVIASQFSFVVQVYGQLIKFAAERGS